MQTQRLPDWFIAMWLLVIVGICGVAIQYVGLPPGVSFAARLALGFIASCLFFATIVAPIVWKRERWIFWAPSLLGLLMAAT